MCLRGRIFNRELINEYRTVCEHSSVMLISMTVLQMYTNSLTTGIWTGLYYDKELSIPPGITQHVGYVLCCAAGMCCGAAKMQSWLVNN